MWGRQHGRVVGVIDVGSNTVRLLVSGGGRPLLTLREALALGADVERLGRIPDAKLAETAAVVAFFAGAARREGAEQLEVLVTSPGRQAANGDDLLDMVASAAQAPARIVSAFEEGRLAFVGALAGTSGLSRRSVAVVDVGGGSAQVAVGSRRTGPVWVQSLDLGSLRLSSRSLPNDPPGVAAVETARAEVAHALQGFEPPEPQAALAVGGSARALRRIAGSRLGPDELHELVAMLAETPAGELTTAYGLRPHRARTLAAGAVILAELQARLRTPLKVVRTGLREGALKELALSRAAA
jgi:exopolyphosphatase/guanosine-5'-triphosphate,3'-diphosphate pyrophosphatase